MKRAVADLTLDKLGRTSGRRSRTFRAPSGHRGRPWQCTGVSQLDGVGVVSSCIKAASRRSLSSRAASWENGYNESFNGKLSSRAGDELLNGRRRRA